MHNYYTYLYNETVFDLLDARSAARARRWCSPARPPPAASSSRCTGAATATATFESMAESLRGGLSLGLSRLRLLEPRHRRLRAAPRRRDVYKRWCAFGLLSSHSRLHGNQLATGCPGPSTSEAVDVLRFFTRLKLPAHALPVRTRPARRTRDGVPMMRAMLLEFPDDPACATLDRQYMLGDALLVAPVFREDGEVEYYLPAGRWTHLLTGEEVAGGGWQRERHGFLSLPLYVREGTLLAMGGHDERPDGDHTDGVELQLHALGVGKEARATVRDLRGAPALRASVTRRGRRLLVSLRGNARGCRLLLHGVGALSGSSAGIEVRSTERGVRLEIPAGREEVQVDL